MSVMDHPLKYIVLDQLTSLVTEAARRPELLFVAAGALGDEMERVGMAGKELDKVRETARAARQLVGHSADQEWKQLGRLGRFRNRKREKEWKGDRTNALIAAARHRVNEITGR